MSSVLQNSDPFDPSGAGVGFSGTASTLTFRRGLAKSGDLEDIFANVPKWRVDHQVLSRSQGRNRGTMAGLGAISMASNFFDCDVRALGAVPRGEISIGVDLAGRPRRRFGGRDLGASDVLIGYDGAELDYLNSAGFRGLSVTLPGELVAQAADRRSEDFRGLTRYRSIRMYGSDRRAESDAWNLFARLVENLHGDGAAWTPQVAAFVGAEIVDAIAGIVGRAGHGEVDDYYCAWHHRRPIARRAEEFMRANLGESIMLHQICAAARASERSVEYAFRDLYGIGAKRFLKILRLNRVRQAIRASDPNGPTIQEIAHGAGFWHMGHFSRDYRQLFGESPSATQRRAGHVDPLAPGLANIQAAAS